MVEAEGTHGTFDCLITVPSRHDCTTYDEQTIPQDFWFLCMAHKHSGVWRFTVDRGTVDEAKPKLIKSKGFSVSGPGFAFGNDGFV